MAVFNGRAEDIQSKQNMLESLESEEGADKYPSVLGTKIYVTEKMKYVSENFASVIKSTVSGTAVRADNVSPIEHIVKLKTSSNNANIKRYSKNLAEVYGFSARSMANKALTNNYGTTISTTEAGNSIEVTQSQAPVSDASNYKNGYFCVGIYNIPNKTSITFSFDVDIKSNPLNAASFAVFCNNVEVGYARKTSGNKYSVAFDWVVNEDYQEMEIRVGGVSGTFSNFQIELGLNVTNYEPFASPIIYTTDANGMLEIPSSSPTMTFFTDTDGTSIDVTYNADTKMYIDSKFAELQAAMISLGGNA